MKIIHILSAILLFVFTLQGCDQVKKDWLEAKKVNKYQSYSSFLEKHPESAFRKEALQKIDSILFKNAIVDLKIKNKKLENLDPNKISSVLGTLKGNEVRDLFSILMEKSRYLKGLSYFITPAKIAEGADLSKILKPSNALLMSGKCTSYDPDNKIKAVCKYSGVLTKKAKGKSVYLDQVLIIGKGEYLAKENVKKINLKGSFTIKKQGKYFLYSTYYPQDAFYFSGGGYGERSTFKVPFGNNTVIRIKGNVDNYFKGVSLKSDDSFPLHLILKDNGLYYLMGKGEIKVDKAKPLIY